MNIILDTNVLLSAAWRNGLPERVVLDAATTSDCEWIVTAPILSEYVSVLRRPKFNLPSELVQRWTDLVEMRTFMIPLPEVATLPLRDPGDVTFLVAAIAGEADFLITGDNDPLSASSRSRRESSPSSTSRCIRTSHNNSR
jgi:uncharacterized protein